MGRMNKDHEYHYKDRIGYGQKNRTNEFMEKEMKLRIGEVESLTDEILRNMRIMRQYLGNDKVSPNDTVVNYGLNDFRENNTGSKGEGMLPTYEEIIEIIQDSLLTKLIDSKIHTTGESQFNCIHTLFERLDYEASGIRDFSFENYEKLKNDFKALALECIQYGWFEEERFEEKDIVRDEDKVGNVKLYIKNQSKAEDLE